MEHRHKDPKWLILLLVLFPFGIWIGGVLLAWLLWSDSWQGALTVGFAMFVSGFQICAQFPAILRWIFRRSFKAALVGVAPEAWLPIEMERSDSHDAWHFFSHDHAVLIDRGDVSELVRVHGQSFVLDPATQTFTNVGEPGKTCAVKVADAGGNDLLGFLLTPHHATDVAIETDPEKRFQWFLEWLGAEPEGAPEP